LRRIAAEIEMSNIHRSVVSDIWSRLAWLGALLVFAFAFQGYRGLYSPDEGRYTAVAMQMLEDGDFIHPQLHPEAPHFTKPPLTYWVLAASIGTLGRSESAARLPGTLAFAATVLLILHLGRRFTPSQTWLPALIYATCVMPYLAATMITTDTLLTLFETLMGLAFVEIAYGDPAARRRWQWLLGVAAGLAFLTKGPPGLLPLLAFAVYSVLRPESGGLRALFSWRALLLLLVVGVSWYLKVVLDQPELLQYFFVDEVYNRVASDAMRRSPQWYGGISVYLPTLLVGGLPWLYAAAWIGWKRRRPRAGWWQRLRADPQRLLIWLWLILPFAIFFFARSRLPLYVLPLFVPLALLLARTLAPLAMPRWNAALILWCIALVGARIGAAFINPDSNDRDLAVALHALLPAKIHEVAFVSTAPRYGLNFYLDTEVERISLKGDKPTLNSQELESELTENEGCRVFLTDPENEEKLKQALTEAGIAFRVIGSAQRYRVLREESSRCDTPGTLAAFPR
jgi:4-amino-4-deoxy-L-arabinose transferase-like glycosyltransferase